MNPPLQDLAGVILAGGSSSRMGCDKALVEIDGRPLVARIADELRQVTNEVWVSSNDPDRYRFLSLPIIGDLFPGQGPLAGLHAAFVRSRRHYVLAVACDLPRVQASWLRALVRRAADCDAVIPCTSDGGVHPLCAVYSRSCLEVLEGNLSSGINKVTDIFASGRLRVCWLSGAEGGFDDRELTNLNTPHDLQKYRARAEPETPRFPTSGGARDP